MKRKVLLFNPPLYYAKGFPYSLDVSVPPLGLLYIASYLNHNSSDFEAEVYDITAQNQDLGKTLEIIKECKPFAVGIGSVTPQLQGTLELASTIKRNCPDVPIFLGGAISAQMAVLSTGIITSSITQLAGGGKNFFRFSGCNFRRKRYS